MKQAPALTAFGAGKVILLGEHAVVYGEPALAAPLSRGIFATVKRGAASVVPMPAGLSVAQRGQLKRAFARAAVLCGQPKVVVALRSTLPLSVGLGSSAAVSVACARALLWGAGKNASVKNVERLALEMEKEFHLTPSGVDHTTSAREEMLLFRKGKATGVAVSKPISLAVVLTGKRPPTRETVAALRARQAKWPKRYQRVMRLIGEVTLEGAAAARAGDHQALGDAMNVNHGLLAALGVSAPGIDHVVHRLRALGALGAKLTGAGGEGGAVIGLFLEPERAIMRLRQEGFDCFASQVAGPRAL
ncbi:MAG: mevalonate kinase [Myxococcaceae bacterium]|nr:mevalonate kinase [Myxococcaceae bacterium]